MLEATRPRAPEPWRLTFVPMAMLLMLMLSGCPGDDNPWDDCACPNLRATAASIDWIGDGTHPSAVDTNIDVAPYELLTRVHFETSEPVELQLEIENRLITAGFALVSDYPYSGTFEGEQWSVGVQTGGSEVKPAVVMFVRIVDNDARAAEILAPLTRVLGTIP